MPEGSLLLHCLTRILLGCHLSSGDGSSSDPTPFLRIYKISREEADGIFSFRFNHNKHAPLRSCPCAVRLCLRYSLRRKRLRRRSVFRLWMSMCSSSTTMPTSTTTMPSSSMFAPTTSNHPSCPLPATSSSSSTPMPSSTMRLRT